MKKSSWLYKKRGVRVILKAEFHHITDSFESLGSVSWDSLPSQPSWPIITQHSSMEGRTAYCQACHSLAYEIDAHDQVLETSFNNAEQPSHSLRKLGAAKKASSGTTKALPSRLEYT